MAWLDQVSLWIKQKEPISDCDEELLALNRAWSQTSLETDTFFQSSSFLEKAFSEIAEKVQHASPDH